MMVRKKFALNKAEGKFMGVCAGLADYSGVDATWIRVGVVVVTLLGGFPWTLIAYGAAVWLAGREPAELAAGADTPRHRSSVNDLRTDMRDIDRRMAEVDSHVAVSNGRLAEEIERLR